MQSTHTQKVSSSCPESSSDSEFDDDAELAGIDGNELSDLDVDLSGEGAKRKPHFLDDDYMEHGGGCGGARENPGESLKIDKSLERDGEISDHILTAAYSKEKKYKNEKKKHFLDVNPIPPPEYREHRSLDRLEGERKSRQKDNYTLHRFIEKEVPNSEVYRGTWPSVSDTNVACRHAYSMPTPVTMDLGPKVECVYSLLSMLGNNNSKETSTKFLELSQNRESCAALRRSGAISILVQLQHNDPDENTRRKARVALHNVVHCHIDDKFARREMKVLKQIELLLDYCDTLRTSAGHTGLADDTGQHPVHAIGTLMKTSFDEDHRHAMCQLGALQTISTLVQLDHQAHGATSEDQNCVLLRRYAGMTLTNLTFGDGNNKATLCLNRGFMRALLSQIDSTSDELVQVTASVLRNLSWRADAKMKGILSEIGAVTILTKAAMRYTLENTLKAILSALWNLSNCQQNKAEFCECEGAIDFLIDMLNYKAPSKTMAVVENAGGILRNVSSYIATKEEYRVVLRRRNCLGILLQQLKSSSLTVVSNASGTLGNLSANSIEDQKFLRDNGASAMLRSLTGSKHKMISTGCTIALRNLSNSAKTGVNGQHLDSVSRSLDLKELPTLSARKQKALEQELDANLANSCSSDEVTTPPKDFGTTSRDLMLRCFKAGAQEGVPESAQRFADSAETTTDESSPVDFNAKYSSEGETPKKELHGFQETDLDQPTDYSKRYAENFTDSDDEKGSAFDEVQQPQTGEDQVKCFYTEGTPRVISHAGSVTDLARASKPPVVAATASAKGDGKKTATFNSGIHSPERPVNYCVEGTPGGLSRCDSLSDIEPDGGSRSKPKTPPSKEKPKEPETAKTSNVNFDETPLMFSRQSSLESLGPELEEHANDADDKSSVVSEFSRLASGIISPSEIPESPLQSMPQSPRQRSFIRTPQRDTNLPVPNDIQPDEINTFAVENTPAQFSCATSLSNLSLDDEPKITKDCLVKEMQLMSHPSEEQEDEYVLHYAEDGSPTKDEAGAAPRSDESDGEDDDGLLENAISMGMNARSTAMATAIAPASTNDDTTMAYCTEDTPAVLSKVGSCSNLSVLSVETRNDTDDGVSDDGLIEAAIQSGISNRRVAEDPIEKMRRGAISPYLRVGDEINRFTVEDSPRAFSTASALSDITVGSGVAGLAKLKSSPPKSKPKLQQLPPPPACDDSLSSLSMESEDDTELLNQAISAGAAGHCYALQKRPLPEPNTTNDSLSSVDSCDSENQSLLDQVVQSGMARVVNKKGNTSAAARGAAGRPARDRTKKVSDQQLLHEVIQNGIMSSARSASASSPSCAPKNVQTTPEVGLDLLTTNGAANTTPGVVNININNTNRTMEVTMTRTGNTNGTTKAQGVDTAAPVTPLKRRECATGGSNWQNVSAYSDLLSQSNEYPALRLSGSDYVEESIISEMEVSNEFMIERQEHGITENSENSKASMEDKRKNPDLMQRSVDRLTEQLVATAEYLRAQQTFASPPVKREDDGSNNNTWNDSNETSFPSLSGVCPLIGSVNDDENTFNDLKSSFSNRNPLPQLPLSPISRMTDDVDATPTNEHHELASMDATLRYESIDTSNTEPTTTVRADAEIKFQLGGEITVASRGIAHAPRNSGPLSIDSSSTMTNSTIIFMEANRVVTELQNISPTDSLASLDLDNIRPPSVMDCVSLSTVTCEFPSSPQLPRQRKTSIPTGIMARRALGQLGPHFKHPGSVDNINSIAGNVDNIKPPSIMDELLDSMMSVASITSEVAEPGDIVDPTSHYETALSEIDDTTLKSCVDLPSDATPVPSDFSSNESTPKKGGIRRALTPKQKRQMAKDRYRTYTVAADMVLKERADQLSQGPVVDDDNDDDDEIIEIDVLPQERHKVTLRQKRKDDRARFETQILDTSQLSLNLSSASEGSESPSARRRITDPDRFRTRTVSSTSTISDHLQFVLREANVVIDSLNPRRKSEEFLLDEGVSDCISLVSNDDDGLDLSIKAVTAQLKYLQPLPPRSINLTRTSTNIMQIHGGCGTTSSDVTSLEYEQNSETESCDQNREFSDSNDERGCGREVYRPRIVKPTVDVNLDSAGDEGCSSPEPRGVRGRKKPAYVSPYRMNSRNSSPKSVSPVLQSATHAKQQRSTGDAKKIPSPSKLIPRNQTIVAKTHVIMNKANLTNKINSMKSGLAKPGFFGQAPKSAPAPTTTRGMCKSKTYTEMSSHCGETTLERQGTFVKEEGTDLDVPVVTSAPPTPAKTSKLPTKIQHIVVPKAAVATTTTPKSRKILPKPQQLPTLKRFGPGVYKSPSVPTVPQRSNSNMSLGSSGGKSITAKSSGNVSQPKKDITSRIAGLWKKVDESKKQQQLAKGKDTRLWIGSGGSAGRKGSEPIPVAPPPLIRSSTFDASPREESAAVTTTKTKESAIIIKASSRTLKSPSSGNLKADGRYFGLRRN